MVNTNLSRRGFLATTGAAVSGLIIGFRSGPLRAGAAGNFNTWLAIEPDDTVRILIGYSEMGQGIFTSLPQVIADELEADWTKIKPEFAPAGAEFNNPVFNLQGTGGSTTTRGSFAQMRTAGAMARAMLEQAAANRWGVSTDKVRAENGRIINTASGETLRYGALALEASALLLRANPPLKDPAQWRYIGKSQSRLDIPLKVGGRARFGIDVEVPGMLVATIAQCPVYGGKLKSVDDAPALAVRGVKGVVPLDNAVVVVAEGYWPAKKGLDSLSPVWDEGDFAEGSSKAVLAQFNAALDAPGAVADEAGNVAAGMAAATKLIEADYVAPYLAHATMEPMNATAHVTADGVTIWAPTQGQGPLRGVVAKVLGVDPEKVAVHTTFLGGGFGRRFEIDFGLQAALVSKAVGAPVKLIWSREEDMGHDFYRPGSAARFKVGLGDDGRPVAWEARIACSSIFSRIFPQFVKDGVDESSVEAAVHTAYDLANRKTDYRLQPSPIPVGFWRSVGNSQNGYFFESMIDESAHAAGVDPYHYRMILLARSPKHAAVLKAAAELAGWGKMSAEKGRAQGIAMVESFGTIVAEVVELTVSEDKEIVLHKIAVAADPGQVIDPRNFEAQLQSAVVYGLTAAVYGKIDVAKGRALQGNFDTYEMVKLAQLPRISVRLVPSGKHMGGAGEPGTPPLAPAVANAIFAANGDRVRALPLMDSGYSLGPTRA